MEESESLSLVLQFGGAKFLRKILNLRILGVFLERLFSRCKMHPKALKQREPSKKQLPIRGVIGVFYCSSEAISNY